MALICPKCGEESPDKARFCSSCASPLAAEESAGREQRKVVTVVFSDLTGSTSLGERLDSESLRQVMSRYYEVMREALEHHGGTVEKFIGDAVMAVFGAPALHEDDALRAVRAAWEMGAALQELNSELEARWGEHLQTRTGVNTGEVVAGDPSKGHSFVVGDAVNVAARLEQAAGPGEILLGPETHRLVRHAVDSEPVEPLELKGKSERVPAFRLLNLAGDGHSAQRSLDSPLVGRERELRLLADTYEQAVETREGRMAVVLGPAGVGKSRLCGEFLASVENEATVLIGRCLPYGSGITLWPVLEVVRAAAGIEEDDSAETAQAKIAERVASDDSALIAERVATALGLSDAAPHPEETSWALRRLLESIASERALIVVFDDIHWGESTFLDLLEYLAEMTTGVPILLLCLARPELRESRPDFGRGKLVPATEITLEPLDQLESRLLIEHLLGEAGLSRQIAERLAGAAQGNPLFLEEMLRGMVDEGVLKQEDGAWQVVGDLSDLEVPPTIQAVLAARLDRLEGRERGVIESAAVIGQEFWRGAVAELLPEESRDVVPKRLEALVRKELLRRGGTPFLEDEAFRFSHLMVRDVAYSGLLKEVRAELHERFSDWLEERTADAAVEYDEIIGYHLEQAARYRGELGVADPRAGELASRAAGRLDAAGRHALARGDMPAAVNLFERSHQLSGDDERARAERGVRLGAALSQTGEFTRGDELLQETIDDAVKIGDDGLEHKARIERALLHLFTAQLDADEAAALAERATAVFEREGEDLGLTRASLLLSAAEIFRGSLANATAVAERAFEHAQRCGSEAGIGSSLHWLVWVRLEGPAEAADVVAASEAYVQRAGETRVAQAAHFGLAGAVMAMQGQIERARESCLRSKRIYGELGLLLFSTYARFWAGEVERLAQDWAAAERELRPSLDFLLDSGERSILSDVAARLSLVMLEQGEVRQAKKLASVAAGSRAPSDQLGRFTCEMTSAKVALAAGDIADAEELGRSAVEIARPTDALNRKAEALTILAEIMIHQGNPAEAATLLREAVDNYERKGNVTSAERTNALLNSLDVPVTSEAEAEPS